MFTFAIHFAWNTNFTFDIGEMAEWSNAAVLKTVDLHGSGGSNPSLSAVTIENQSIKRFTPNFTPTKAKVGRKFIVINRPEFNYTI